VRHIGVVIVLALLSSCDKTVYLEAELRAQEHFGSVEVGHTEESVIQLFGPPLGTVKSTESGLVFEDHSAGSPETLALPDDETLHLPELIRFMPKRPTTGKVLVYNEGTVTAYYFIDANGLVEFVSVHTT